jgi:hypothetical protein
MCDFLEWGFSQDPFQAVPLPPSELGRTLLVGRSAEVAQLMRHLRGSSRIATLEGPNGTGKTSLANVAAYLSFDEYVSKGVGGLLIPCNHVFQPQKDLAPEVLEHRILLEVAQSLLSWQDKLKAMGRTHPGLKSLDRWLNSPVLSSWQASGGPPGFQMGIGRSVQANEAQGFADSGFRHAVLSALTDIFGPNEGVVCILDNLELVETSTAAKQHLEQLRDLLFTKPGLRWVLAGAGGIVEGAASSPRLEGFLSKPIEIRGIDPQCAPEILTSRMRAFRRSDDVEPYLPISPEAFAKLYKLLAENIRSAIGRTADYCSWVTNRGVPCPQTPTQKNAAFSEWLEGECLSALRAADRLVSHRAWQVLDAAVEKFAGYFSPGDFEAFNFRAVQNLRPYVKELETAGLVTASRDDSDRRRKTIQITPKGWLVLHARSAPPS